MRETDAPRGFQDDEGRSRRNPRETEVGRVQALPEAAEAGAGGRTEPGNLGSERKEEGSALGHPGGAGRAQ